MYGYLGRSFDSQPYLVAAYVDHGNDDLIANNDLLISISREYEHDFTAWLELPHGLD